MSVWNSPCYRAEPLSRSLQCYGQRAKYLLPGDFSEETDFTVDDSAATCRRTEDRAKDGTLNNVEPRKFREICNADPAVWAGFIANNVTKSRSSKAEDTIYTYFKEDLKPTCYGLKAVYTAFDTILSCADTFKEEFDFQEYRQYQEEVWKISAAPSRVNNKAWQSIGGFFSRAKDLEWYYAKNVVEVVRHVWVMDRAESVKNNLNKCTRLIRDIKKITIKISKSNDKEEIEIMKNQVKKLRRKITVDLVSLKTTKQDKVSRVSFIKFKTGYFMIDRMTGKTAVLFGKDHERLIQMLTSHSKCDTYFKCYDWQSEYTSMLMTSKYYQYLNGMRKAMRDSSWDDCNKICRAYDVVLFTYYAELASDLSTMSLDAQKAKFDLENLSKFVNREEVIQLAEASEVGVKEVVEILKCYKILPCPDFCHYSGLPEMARKNNKHRSMAIDKVITFNDGKTIELKHDEFLLYQKLQAIITYKARHDRLPGRLIAGPNVPVKLLQYPQIQLSDLTVDDMRFIDINGTFAYVNFDGIEHELVKDKTTAATNQSKKELMTERIQILKYLFDADFINQEKVEELFYSDKVTWDKFMKVAWKPETKKPGSRLFCMANDPDRRALSSLEHNIADYIVNKPGVSVGMSDQDLFQKMHNMYERFEIGCTKLMVSFDLEAWSPMMAPDWKLLMLEKWGMLFGKDKLPRAMQIFSERTLYADKLGHFDTWENIGVDIEGFNGKLNTDGHVDVMGYLIYKMRGGKLFECSANFMALIDDGLMECQIPDDNYEFNVDKVIKVIDEGYKAFGHSISWDKTYLSRYFSMYLNEITLDGQRITPGVKSFLKIGVPQDVPIENLMDELMSHASTVRGAIKAGTDHNVAYDAYILEYYLSLKRWSGYAKLDVRDQALRTFLPFAHGGYALNSLFSLATNESFDSLEASIANCKMITLVFPNLSNYYEKILNTEPEDMDAGIILRNPTSMHFSIKKLTNQKFASNVRAHVLLKAVHPYIREISRQLGTIGEFGFDSIIMANLLIHNTVRELLWKIDPRSVVETLVSKLSESGTAAMIIGFKKVMAIKLLYRNEARKVITNHVTIG